MAQIQQISSTFTLRRICQKIQNSIHQVLKNTQKNIKKKQLWDKSQQKSKQQLNLQSVIFQNIKADTIRIITLQLPFIVNYQSTINQKILDLKQQNQQYSKQIKKIKQNYKQTTIQRDTLKVQLLDLQTRINNLQDQKAIAEEKYNEVLLMAKKYMKKNQELQEYKIQNQYRKDKQLKQKQLLKQNQTQVQYQNQSQNKYSFPLQIKQKLNEAQNVLKQSPIPNESQLQSDHFYLSSQIVGCQKQLLQYQLKQSTKQIAELRMRIEQQIQYSTKLQKQVQMLQKLMQGERRLKDNLDRELYMLINNNKEMKIQLLEQKAKYGQSQQEIIQLQEEIKNLQKINKQSQNKFKVLMNEFQKKQKIQQQLSQTKTNLQISQRKYEQLRRLKQQLQARVEQFQTKLQQIQKKQSQQQFKSTQVQITMKQQNCVKIKQIQQMAIMIKQKYQKKINILQISIKQVKDKYKYLKHQNQRLYEGLQVQAKKQMKLDEKYKKIKQKNDLFATQNITLKKDKQIIQQKLKTQIMMSKQFKRQLNFIQRIKQRIQKKLNRIKITVLPKIMYQMRLLQTEKQKIQSQVLNSNDFFNKLKNKSMKQIQKILQIISENHSQNQSSFSMQLNNRQCLIDNLKKQTQQLSSQKLQIFEKLNNLDQTNRNLSLKIKISQQNIKVFQQNLNNKNTQIKYLNTQNQKICNKKIKLQTQIQNFIHVQKDLYQQIQILKQKQNQVQQFYDLIQQLTDQNNQLKQSVLNYQRNQKKYNIQSAYTISYKNDLHNKKLTYSNQNNSTSCVHLHGTSLNKKPSYTNVQPPVRQVKPSLDNKHNYPSQKASINTINTKSHLTYNMDNMNKIKRNSNLSVNNQEIRPIFLSRTNLKTQENQLYSINSSNDRQNRIKNDFETQKDRLDEIKRQYKNIMLEKIKDQHGQAQVNRGSYNQMY